MWRAVVQRGLVRNGGAVPARLPTFSGGTSTSSSSSSSSASATSAPSSSLSSSSASSTSSSPVVAPAASVEASSASAVPTSVSSSSSNAAAVACPWNASSPASSCSATLFGGASGSGSVTSAIMGRTSARSFASQPPASSPPQPPRTPASSSTTPSSSSSSAAAGAAAGGSRRGLGLFLTLLGGGMLSGSAFMLYKLQSDPEFAEDLRRKYPEAFEWLQRVVPVPVASPPSSRSPSPTASSKPASSASALSPRMPPPTTPATNSAPAEQSKPAPEESKSAAVKTKEEQEQDEQAAAINSGADAVMDRDTAVLLGIDQHHAPQGKASGSNSSSQRYAQAAQIDGSNIEHVAPEADQRADSDAILVSISTPSDLPVAVESVDLNLIPAEATETTAPVTVDASVAPEVSESVGTAATEPTSAEASVAEAAAESQEQGVAPASETSVAETPVAEAAESVSSEVVSTLVPPPTPGVLDVANSPAPELRERLASAERRVCLLIAEIRALQRAEGIVLQEALSVQLEKDNEVFGELIGLQEEVHKRELAALEEKLRTSHKDEMQRRLKEQEIAIVREARAKIESLRKEYEAELHSRLEEVARRNEIERRIALDDLEANSVSKFNDERASWFSTVDSLQGRVQTMDELMKQHADYERRSNEIHNIWLAVSSMHDALYRQRPFAAELQRIKSLAKGDELIQLAVSDVEKSNAAKTGVPTVQSLQERFETVFREGRRAAFVPPKSGFWGHTYSIVMSKITFPQRGLVGGQSAEARLARAKHWLTIGDVDKAVSELERIEGAAAEILKDFLSAAKQRLRVQTALNVIRAEAATLVHSLS